VTKKRTHYHHLQVRRTASLEVIKAAYRSLSAKYHPDRNPGDERCARIMATLNEAYAVLSDPVRRKRHDESIDATSAQSRTEPPQETSRFHSRAQRQAEMKAQWEARSGRPARADAVELSPAAKGWVMIVLIGLIVVLVYALQPAKESDQLPYQSDALVEQDGSSQINAVETLTNENVVKPATEITTSSGDTAGGTIAAAPNGSQWPTSAGYVDGYPRLRTSGYSLVTVDNSGNESDVFLKLVKIEPSRTLPIRHIFIPKYGTFTMKSLPPGQYDVRYQGLSDGSLMRSEDFELLEFADANGIRFSNITMKLFKDAGGTLQTYPLDPSEF
jgi:curved DNA-binding protein CbpA